MDKPDGREGRETTITKRTRKKVEGKKMAKGAPCRAKTGLNQGVRITKDIWRSYLAGRCVKRDRGQ